VADLETAMVDLLPRLGIYARTLTRNRDAANDLVQETVERALSRRHLWQPELGARPWLFTIMHNIYVNLKRQQNRRGLEVEVDGVDWMPELADQPRQMAGLEMRDVARAYGRLPEDQRVVLFLVAIETMPYREVSETLDIPMGTVMSRLSRARRNLRLDLAESHTGGDE
jgi:RNA polymerase sigma-70 factor, ECF subfamily